MASYDHTILLGGAVDYNDTVTVITLSATQPRDCVNIPIEDDSLVEDSETFGVSLTTSSSLAIVEVISSATVTIEDTIIGLFPACKKT